MPCGSSRVSSRVRSRSRVIMSSALKCKRRTVSNVKMSRTDGNNVRRGPVRRDVDAQRKRTAAVGQRGGQWQRALNESLPLVAGNYTRDYRDAAYLHGKQSLPRLSDVLILWKQFLRRCTLDKDAAVSGVVVCTEGKGINRHDRKTGILSPRWWINGRNVARNAARALLCVTIFGKEYHLEIIIDLPSFYFSLLLLSLHHFAHLKSHSFDWFV